MKRNPYMIETDEREDVDPAKDGIVSRKPIYRPWTAQPSVIEYAPERKEDASED